MTVSADNLPSGHWKFRDREAEIARIRKELSPEDQRPDDQYVSLLEAGVLIAAGVLGLCGAGLIAGQTLQLVVPKVGQLPDPILQVGLAAQKGLHSLGKWGPALAAGFGWLLSASLGVRTALPPRDSDSGSLLRAWPAWCLAAVLVILPFFDFGSRLPATGLLTGFLVSFSLYAVVPVLQSNRAVGRLFEGLSDGWFGIPLALGTLGLLLVGSQIPSAPAVLTSVLVAAAFSCLLLVVGCHKRAKVRHHLLQRQILDRLLAEHAEQQEREAYLRKIDEFLERREKEEAR